MMLKYARCKKCKTWLMFKTENTKCIKSICPNCDKRQEFVFSKKSDKDLQMMFEYLRQKKEKGKKSGRSVNHHLGGLER